MYYLSSSLTKGRKKGYFGVIMPGRVSPTPQELENRVAAYCERYGVTPGPTGLPPYPSGQRETPQHREWIAVYKAHRRLRQDDRS